MNWDVVAGYKLPFDDTKDDISWTLKLVPGVKVGGIQVLALDTPYLAVDFFFDTFPLVLTVGTTYLQWDPPMFENFCMASGWSLTLMDYWLNMDISIWECQAGLFDWLLNGNGHECGLNTYKFDNDIYEWHYSAHDRKGDFITNTCLPPLPPADATGTTDASTTTDATVTPAATTLIDAGWF